MEPWPWLTMTPYGATYLPSSLTEIKLEMDPCPWLSRQCCTELCLSNLSDGKIIRVGALQRLLQARLGHWVCFLCSGILMGINCWGICKAVHYVKTAGRLGWRDGSVPRNTCYSCKGPSFGSQHPHGDLQSTILVPGDLASSGLQKHQVYTCHMYKHADKTLIT